MRRVTKTAFRDFGVGKVAFEQQIQEQIDELIVHLDKTEGNPVQLHDMFSMAVGNVMYGIVFGKKYGDSYEYADFIFALFLYNSVTIFRRPLHKIAC